MELVLGEEFITNVSCGHSSLCKLCAAGMCNVNIDEGTIDDIQCGECSCIMDFTPSTLDSAMLPRRTHHDSQSVLVRKRSGTVALWCY
jgi:hypothetical protein